MPGAAAIKKYIYGTLRGSRFQFPHAQGICQEYEGHVSRKSLDPFQDIELE